MTIEDVVKFLEKTKTFFLATEKGKQPAVRPFGTIMIFEGRLYIQTGKKKDVSKEIEKNPHVAICAYDGEEWLRLEGVLVEDNRWEAQEAMFDKYPELGNMYKVGDGNTVVYYFLSGETRFCSFHHDPIVFEF